MSVSVMRVGNDKVKFEDGTEVYEVSIHSTNTHLRDLGGKDPSALLELLCKCRNPDYNFIIGDTKQVLKNHYLMSEDGSISPDIVSIIRNCVEVDGPGIKWRKISVQEESIFQPQLW